MTLSLILILGIFVLGMIGAAIAILFAKGEIKEALIPGIIAGLIVIVVGFFYVPFTTTTCALVAALILGIVIQIVLPGEKVKEMLD